jgi:N-acylglucosamine 2-epimerase
MGVEKTINCNISEGMKVFLDKTSGLIYENVRPDESLEESFNARLLNAGQGIVTMWFMMDLGQRKNEQKQAYKATETVLTIINRH